jgi:hypothetical protein
MTRAIGAGDRASAGAAAFNIYAAVWVLDSDGVWRDLTNFLGADWVVSIEYGATLDEPVATARITLVREQIVGGGMVSLAPQIAASAANRNGAGAYVPLLNPARLLRILTATVDAGVSAAGHWKRVFDGKIDGADPGGDAGTLTLRCRDRGAWLQDTEIETLRNYGTSDGAPVQAVMQGIINDNGVPYAPVISTPVDPAWLLHPYTQDKTNVMDAVRALALQIGFDLRYLFLTDGDVDPVLVFAEPPRTKTDPDWTFGPDEYTAIPKAEISDDNVRNAVTINYSDLVLGLLQSITRTNAASIAAFHRRWMEVTEAATSNIDTAAEATRLGDAIVADLGEPGITHTMESPYLWFVSINDLCRFLANDVHYDDYQDLAVVGIQHTLEGGHGTTTLDCRGTPAGAYKRWLSFAGTGGGPAGNITMVPEVISESDTQITVKITASAAGSNLSPAIELLWTGVNPPVTKLSGADPFAFVASGSEWTFAKPTPGSGSSQCGFGASTTGGLDMVLYVNIPEGTAFAGPAIDAPSITPVPDPTDEFDITWVAHTVPTGATYKCYWRPTTGTYWRVNDVGAATALAVTHSMLGHIVGTGTANATFQSYVEMYSAGGSLLAQSVVSEVGWEDLGLG